MTSDLADRRLPAESALEGRRSRLSGAKQALLHAWLQSSGAGGANAGPIAPPADAGCRRFEIVRAHASPRPLLRLPNGLAVAFQSVSETMHLYADIFEDECYFQHGIDLAANAIVFDVGANIGLFSVCVATRWPAARVYAFEPAPPLLPILTLNTGFATSRVKLFPCGLGSASTQAPLTFYPHSSGMSTFSPDVQEEKDVLRRLMKNEIDDGTADASGLIDCAEELLEQRFARRVFSCPVRRLSDVIDAERVDRVDLLKIDVQKSERDVLDGIDARHWPCIRQIVIEVHDLDGRLGQITALLRARGFAVAAEQSERLRGTILFNVFARRTAPALAS